MRHDAGLSPGSSAADYWHGIVVDTLWTAVGYGVRHGSAAAASILVARLLGTEAFGEYGMIASTIALLGTAADLGMSVSSARFVAAYRASDPERASRSLTLSVLVTASMACLVSALLVPTASYVATGLLDNENLVTSLRLGALAVVFSAVGSALSGGLRGLGLFKQMARVEVVLAVFNALLMVAGALLGKLEGAVSGFVAGTFFRAAAYAIPLHSAIRARGWRVSVAGIGREARMIVGFSVPAFASGFLVTPALWAVRVMLARTPSGYAELGAFSAALQWQSLITAMSTVFGLVLLPSLSELYEVGNRKRLLETFNSSLSILAAGELGLTILLLVANRYIVAMYGYGFQTLDKVLPLLLIAAFFHAVLSVPGQMLAAINRMWVGFGLNLVWAAMLLGVTALAAPRFGAVGASAAYLLAYLVHAITSALAVGVLLRLPVGRTMTSLLGGAALALAGVAWWSTQGGSSVAATISVAGVAYVALRSWRDVHLALESWLGARIVSR